MLALLLAVASSVTYGSADFVGGFASRDGQARRVATVSAPVSLALVTVAALVAGARWSTTTAVYGTACGLAGVASIVLLYRCLALGPMSVLSPLTASISALVPVAAGLLQGERPSPAAITGIALVPLAVVLVSFAPDGNARRPTLAAVLTALGAGIALGAEVILLQHTPRDSGLAPLIITYGISSTVFLAMSLLPGDRPELPQRPGLAAASGAGSAAATIFLLYALRHGQLTMIAVISALYPVTTVLLARLVLHERLRPSRLTGLVLALAAITLLAVG
ncbi:EamA family transporter [Streptomyces flavidovirens]